MALLGVVALNVILEGHLFRPLNWLERLLLLPAAGGLLHPSLWASLGGIVIFAGLAAWQWLSRDGLRTTRRTGASGRTAVTNPAGSGGDA